MTAKAAIFGLLLGVAGFSITARAQAKNEIVTIPLVLGDYYVWAYAEAIDDRAAIYGWSTAGVDALGWGVLAFSGDDSGLFLVNLAGISKTAYPVVTLLTAKDGPTRTRAWIALGTHTVTLLSLDLLGRPELSVNTALGPRRDGTGLVLALGF
ncbi:MAG: hypothetical protein ACREL1_08945 [bacterium]